MSNIRPLLQRSLAILLTTILGVVFVYSAYTKLFPIIEPFEFTFVDMGIANWYSAPVIARLFIGLEFWIGLLLLAHYKLKIFTLPLTAILLILLSGYLLLQIVVSGNTGNCGCFGEHLRMTPLQALIKNAVMLAICIGIYFLSAGWSTRFHGLLSSVLFVSAAGLPFLLNPVDYTYTSNNLEEKVGYPLELNLLYTPDDSSKVEVPKIELRKGKQVLAFLSLTCSHCRVAAKKFRLIKKNNPSLPIYFILNGDKKKYPSFIEDTKADNIPYSYCLGKTFVQLASAQLPRIYYINDGIVVKKVDYFELNQYAIEDWISEKSAAIP